MSTTLILRKRRVAPPDLDMVRQLVSFDPETGVFTWRSRPREMFRKAADFVSWNKRWAGNPICMFLGPRTRKVRVAGRDLVCGRLAWALANGEWPEGIIDHINGNPADNRVSNLRVCSRGQNACNRRKQVSQSRFKGVTPTRSKTSPWAAQIAHANRKYHLGCFKSEAEAARAYDAAATRLHGEFARLNFPNDSGRAVPCAANDGGR